jgi:hypothetical protein
MTGETLKPVFVKSVLHTLIFSHIRSKDRMICSHHHKKRLPTPTEEGKGVVGKSWPG